MRLPVLALMISAGCVTPAPVVHAAVPIQVQPEVVDAGVVEVVDAGSPVVVEAAPPAPAPVYVSLGLDEKGQVQRCDPKTKLLSFSSLMKTRPEGEVSVRAPLWKRPTQVCTAGLPPFCMRYFVLAATRMNESNAHLLVHLDAMGQLSQAEVFACTGEGDAEKCPLPVDGREWGLRGTLNGSSFVVAAVCRV